MNCNSVLLQTIVASTMQVISDGTLTKMHANNLPHPLPSQAMLSFDDQTHICTKKNDLSTFVNIVLGEGGEGGLRSNCALKNTYSTTK